MIVYEFPVEEFSAAEGYTRIKVRDSKIEFEAEPDAATVALCEKYGGKLVEAKAKKSTKKAAKTQEKEGGE